MQGGDYLMKIEVHNRVSDFNSYRSARVKSLFNAENGCNFDLTIDADLDFDWNRGVVVGPSGSGKTSIGKIIFGEKTSINRETIEEMKSKIVSDKTTNPGLSNIIKDLSPEEIMAWFGYLDDIKNSGGKESYYKALAMMRSEDNKNNATCYVK